jgi:osmotically inducible protein OsmC
VAFQHSNGSEPQANTIGGRDGGVSATDGHLNVKLSTPKELGGLGGEGTNPEQLFAAGYAACFTGAMNLVASQQKIRLPQDMSIEGLVAIGPIEAGFSIEVELRISAPGFAKEQVEAVVAQAHKVCPYSNATRGNIDVTLTVI